MYIIPLLSFLLVILVSDTNINVFKGQTSKSLSFGSGSAREDKSETPVNAGPDPCLPELCDKV